MRKVTDRLTMRQKILLLCLCTIVSVYAGVMLCVRVGSERFYERKLSLITQQTIEQSGAAISAELRNMVSLIHYSAISAEMQSLLELDMDNSSQYAVAMSGLEPILTQIAAKNDYIDSVELVVDGHSFFGLNHPMRYDLSQEFAASLQTNLIYWSDTVYYNAASKKHVLPVIMSIPVDRRSQERYPFVIVSLNVDELEKTLSRVSSHTQGSIGIYDGDTLVIGAAAVGAEDCIVNSAPVAANQWQIRCVQQKSVLFEDLDHVYRRVFGITLVIALGCIVLAWLLAGSLTRPLRQLAQMTHRLEKRDFSVRFHSDARDEIGKLGHSFNDMCTELEYYIQQLQQEKQEVKRTAELKRKAEFRALQAHINPHFLYNTLDSMYWYSVVGNKEDLAKLTIALSEMLRIALSKGKEMIPIGDELRHVENYLQIEKIILKDKFDYAFRIGDGVRELPIIKIVLQPLVENSLVHGLKNVETGGLIQIGLSRMQDVLRICVEDNGCGFDREKSAANAGRGSGYALKNITQRLELYYGAEAVPQIESVCGEYTRITICIPVEKMKQAAKTAEGEVPGDDPAARG